MIIKTMLDLLENKKNYLLKEKSSIIQRGGIEELVDIEANIEQVDAMILAIQSIA